MELGKQVHPSHPKGYGMQKLCHRHLDLYVDKFGQNADWRQMQHCDDLKQYAALDPYLHLKLYECLSKLIDAGQATGVPQSANLALDQNIHLLS